MYGRNPTPWTMPETSTWRRMGMIRVGTATLGCPVERSSTTRDPFSLNDPDLWPADSRGRLSLQTKRKTQLPAALLSSCAPATATILVAHHQLCTRREQPRRQDEPCEHSPPPSRCRMVRRAGDPFL